MAERVLSIELGYSLTKVCEMDLGSKSPKIYNSFVVNTPEGMLKDGIVDTDDEFINTFLRMMTVKRIKTRKAVFTISSSKIATREARIPYCKPGKIKDLVRANLTDYFPIDGSQYLFSHSVLGQEYEVQEEKIEGKEPAKLEEKKPLTKKEQALAELESGQAKVQGKSKRGKAVGYKLLLLAAPRQLIQSYEKLAQAIGLTIQSLDYNGNSIYQAAKDECRDGVQLIVKVDEKGSLLMVLEDGTTTLNRTIPYGIDDAIKMLMQTSMFGDTKDYEKALEVARRKQVLMPSFAECDTNDTNEEIAVKSEMTQSLRALAGGIIRVIDYYNANHTTKPIEKMLITGMGADFLGLDVLLTSEIGLKIRDITHVNGVDIGRMFRGSSYSEYVGCIGATLDPINFYPQDAAEENAGKDTSVSGSALAVGVLAVCLVASAVMIGYSYMKYSEAQQTNTDYKNTIERLTPAHETYVACEKLKNDVKYVESLDIASRTRNENFNDFLAALENSMPQTFMLDTLAATPEGVSMSATVSTKEEVAATVAALKKIEGFIAVDTSAVAKLENTETGEVKYAFSVDMVYAPLEERVVEEAVAEGEAE